MAGTRHKRPESVLVVVFTRGGEVLMLQRRLPADFWQSVTGSLEWGEAPASAACRELREETGLEAGAGVCLRDRHESRRFAILPAWRGRYAPAVRYNLEHVFSAELAAPRPVHLNPGEHLAYRWLPWREAAALAASWTNRDAILRCLASRGA